MIRPTVVFAFIGVLLAVVVALSVAPGSLRAQDLPPRPPTPTPSATPTPIVEDEDDSSARPAPGRLTGTVINLSTGAPAPNVAVRVGERIVVSDRYGNYDRSGIPAGAYEVALALPADWGRAT